MSEEIINKVIEKVTDVAEIVIEVKESGADLMNEKIEDIMNSLQIIDKSGFSLKDIGMSLGIPPEINGTFTFDRNVPDEEWEKLFAETEDKQTLNMLLKSLFKAQDMVEKMKLGAFKLDSVTVVLGIPPGISLKFKPGK